MQFNNILVIVCIIGVTNVQGILSNSIRGALGQTQTVPYGSELTIKNGLTETQVFNFKFLNQDLQGYQNISAYSAFCHPSPGGPPGCCAVELEPGQEQVFVVKSDKEKQASITITVGEGNWPDGPCAVTNLEFNLHGNINAPDQDTVDVSYVNGYNYGVVVSDTQSQNIIINAQSKDLQTILNTPGVYPPGCDVCTPSSKSSAPIWPNCPATPYGGRMPANMCKPVVDGHPATPCQLTYPTNTDYTITFVEMTH